MGSFVGRSATATHCTTNSVVALRQTCWATGTKND
jgi:hypothetical protein